MENTTIYEPVILPGKYTFYHLGKKTSSGLFRITHGQHQDTAGYATWASKLRGWLLFHYFYRA